ncbi:LacI family transcriptional regulator [Ruminococcus sp. CLA-AA-H200]|uniref:LacI family transcriptional regulator n=1 Tax=Ruminococcus turbiniformis TaxID=2881258 RepID=A0ABS8G1Q1_9FIRM|nr:LacI family DNA-binding transcriptional regulator [Ruminococcus turbiniformis]MCC2256250.1 LacI family transcriptional regulator [Ruminococcus turbiniformis]
MSEKKATLNDVAVRAGVSAGTVSKYINNSSSVKEINREKIEEAIKTLNFTPNVYAQKLAKGKSNTVLLCIISEKNISPSSWLYQLPIIQALNDLLVENGYSMQIRIIAAEETYQLKKCVINCMAGKEADGIALLSVWDIPADLVTEMKQRNFPYVLIEGVGSSFGENGVGIDNRKMVKELVHILAELGHEKIGFINIRSRQEDMRQRALGYREGLLEEGLAVEDSYMLYGDFSIESGYRCVKEYFEKGGECTAFIGGNDNMAVGAIKAVQALNMSVPEDISVIGIDDSIAAAACTPKLQTVHFELGQMGHQAALQLLEQIQKNKCIEMQTIIPYRMVQGESIARAKKPSEK